MKKISWMIKAVLSLTLILVISACDNTPLSTEPLSKKSTTFSVVDSQGTTINLTKPAERIIALAPHVVENVFTAGAGNALVGIVDFSYYPEEAKNLPVVGSYKKLNLEAIIELKPDLIIAWESGNTHNSYTRLQELGFKVYVDQPNNLSDVVKSILDIGVMSGTQEVAIKNANDYLTKLNAIKLAYKDKPKVSSLYQVWNQPLRTISGNHIISDAMEICGGINLYADEIPVAPVINIESVIERNPEAIFASGMANSRPEWLNDWKQWPSLQAVKNDNLFFVNPDHIQRHTVRLLLGLDTICKQLDSARNKKEG